MTQRLEPSSARALIASHLARHEVRLAHAKRDGLAGPSCAIMPSPALFKRHSTSVTDDGSAQHPKGHTRSSPPSPKAEFKNRPRDPYPIPSNNPASQYTLLDKLGTGSFGTVYKAMHNETKQIVAIKQIGMFLSIPRLTAHSRLISSRNRSRRLGRRYLRNSAGNCQSSAMRF
jgi:hypothetical protein